MSKANPMSKAGAMTKADVMTQAQVMTFRTVKESVKSEVVIEKSRFIGYLLPVTSEEVIKDHLAAIKKEHYNASHHCYAYRLLGDLPTERAADDGEPSQTAGMPMLEVLRGEDLWQVLLVSVRYFGGTKLGTGGLVRAYTASAKESVMAASLITKGSFTRLTIEVDYALSGTLDYELKKNDKYIEEIVYTEKVIFHIYEPTQDVDRTIQWVRELANGQVMTQKGETLIGYAENNKIIGG